jgi:hypothetical protein
MQLPLNTSDMRTNNLDALFIYPILKSGLIILMAPPFDTLAKDCKKRNGHKNIHGFLKLLMFLREVLEPSKSRQTSK